MKIKIKKMIFWWVSIPVKGTTLIILTRKSRLTDKRVPIPIWTYSVLDPADIEFHYFSAKKIKVTQILPKVQKIKIKKKYASWQPIEYMILGGMVLMELHVNHLEEDEDEETYAGGQALHLANFISETLGLQSTVVVTHINPHSHVSTQKNLMPFDRIIKINNKKLKR